MKLLEYPTDLPFADVIVMCETWEEFDRACRWLIDNGAPLEWLRQEDVKDVPVIMRNGMASYYDVRGRAQVINHDIQRGAAFSVQVEEINVLYQVHAPEFIR